jgi:hypothetical protein
MSHQLIHPKSFPDRYGLPSVPTKPCLYNWRKKFGFPESVGTPRGHYRLEDVDAWFAARQPKTV